MMYSLDGVNGNAYSVMSYVVDAMKHSGMRNEIPAYQKKAMSGDYDDLMHAQVPARDFPMRVKNGRCPFCYTQIINMQIENIEITPEYCPFCGQKPNLEEEGQE